MKFQFLHTSFAPVAVHDLSARAIVHTPSPRSVSANNDDRFQRRRLVCRWRRDTESGRLVAHWSNCT